MFKFRWVIVKLSMVDKFLKVERKTIEDCAASKTSNSGGGAIQSESPAPRFGTSGVYGDLDFKKAQIHPSSKNEIFLFSSSSFLFKRRPLQRCVSMLQTDMFWLPNHYYHLFFAYEKFGVLFKSPSFPSSVKVNRSAREGLA
jgi:hypothetical protein